MTAVTPKQLIQQNMKMMVKSLPGSETARKRFQQAALSVCSSPNIQKCDPTSVLKSIYQCARLNLIPDPILQHVAVVPFRNAKKQVTEATLVIMYKGLIELMKRANPALSIKAGTVYMNDDYELLEGSEDRLRITKRWWEKGLEKSGEPLFYYAVVREPNAEPVIQIISALEAGDIGRASKAGTRPGTPWYDHPERMGEKTAIKRIERFVRMDPEKEETKQFREAMEFDDRTDEGEDIGTDDGLLDSLGEPSQNVDDLPEGATKITGKVIVTNPERQETATFKEPLAPVDLRNAFIATSKASEPIVAAAPSEQKSPSKEMVNPFAQVVRAWSNVSRCEIETAEHAVTKLLKLKFELEPQELTRGSIMSRILEQISGREIQFEMYEES